MPKESKRRSVTWGVPDLVGEKIEELKRLFPEAVCEGKVDFGKLKATLGEELEERRERYSFTWAGKQDAIRLLQAPSRATLIPAPEESVDFEATGNLFIEGDNLEVLKLLYKPYFGRVKMIYIDPPYNTGNDFIYPDNFADPLDYYLKLTGQKDSEGNLLTSNPETSGRYHSAWLSMMYPRLFLARQLLREDGVIFVSIDDHEAHNLRMLMNEILGEENFVCSLIWRRRQNVDSRAKTGVSVDHEYAVIYRKVEGTKLRGQEKDLSKYSNPDNDPRGAWASDNLVGLATKQQRPNLHYDLVNPETGLAYPCTEAGWRYSRQTMSRLISDGRVLWPTKADGRPRFKRYLNDLESDFTGLSSVLETVYNTTATKELKDIFDGQDVMDFPKPKDYLKLLVQQATLLEDASLILDFFAGSGTTAQAVLDLNREDGGNRRFILVQLPEPTGRKDFPTIADIGKERIRRVIAKLKKEKTAKLPSGGAEDLGFRVFRLAASHHKPWSGVEEKKPGSYAATLTEFQDSLIPGWTPEDLIWEVALKEGFGLNSTIEKLGVPKHGTYHRVTDPDKDQRFTLCLEDKLNVKDLKALNLAKDDLFICRDTALTDELAANLALQCRLKTI